MIYKKNLNLDIIRQHYLLMYADTFSEAWKSIPGLETMIKDPGNVSGAVVGTQDANGKLSLIVILEKAASADEIVHECFHLFSNFMRLVGSEHNQHTEELHAYILQKIFRDITETIKKIEDEQRRKTVTTTA
jgi:hypothetical protein